MSREYRNTSTESTSWASRRTVASAVRKRCSPGISATMPELPNSSRPRSKLAATLEDNARQDDFYVNEGINKFSDDENGGKYVYEVGRHEGFTWGSESYGYYPADYYKFNGIWKSTNEDNLTTDD